MIHFIDGQFLAKDSINVSIDDRGYYFGDGVYEVVKVYDGELYTAEEHIERLFQSASKVKMTVPYSEQQLIDIAKELVKVNGIVTGHIYMQVTRGVAARVHQFPNPGTAPVVTAYAVHNPRPMKTIENGVRTIIVDDIRWLRCDIKSLNLLGNVLAKQEAYEAGCAEAIFVRDGIVTEGSSSNMFGIKDGVVYTHPASNLILNGITRRVVLKLCEQNGITVKEETFSPDEALEMDEFFMTSTTAEITPVIMIDGKAIGSGEPGPITKKLQEAFTRQIPVSVVGE
ncbi:D-amino-acid transaminase [Sporosarcina thermotolerans]|uniref:D-alanine aminotransferase n=1 Tax=Sporosarcina thermotolerans TaxID=633404 RepID=A0AAW9AAB6_9BACL|nr:D-amino-acid transaminase [Sporosarcina thermotolerans]MDW0117139.1 D-amino-acid transaminase [Sporosarcina thermotolerans]WHT47779.1 D-amino-acid transaminase [Sporosarcina thermotolerans]